MNKSSFLTFTYLSLLLSTNKRLPSLIEMIFCQLPKLFFSFSVIFSFSLWFSPLTSYKPAFLCMECWSHLWINFISEQIYQWHGEIISSDPLPLHMISPMRTSAWLFTSPMPLVLNLVTLDICVHLIHFLQWSSMCFLQGHRGKQLLVASAAIQRGPGNALTPQSKDPHPSLGSRHTLRFLDEAADPESLYWALRATALDIEGIKHVLNH